MPKRRRWKLCACRAALGFSFAILLAAVPVRGQSQDPRPQLQQTQQSQPAQQAQPQPPTNAPAQQQPQAGQSQPAQAQPTQSQSGQSTQPQAPAPASTPPTAKQKDDRIFGVMPNYLTVNGVDVQPLTWKGKYKITAEGAFDPYEFVLVGVLAGIRQAEDTDKPFGQGTEGYAKRYGSGFADQAIGNMMTGAVYPSLLRTDPRYYRQGTGSVGRRLFYAATRIFVTRTDRGNNTFNASEFLGDATAAGISNLYYPVQDHTWANNLNTFATQISVDALGNVLKEFWPDLHHWISRKKDDQ